MIKLRTKPVPPTALVHHRAALYGWDYVGVDLKSTSLHFVFERRGRILFAADHNWATEFKICLLKEEISDLYCNLSYSEWLASSRRHHD